MKLGSSVYIEALVSMIEQRKHFNTGSSRRLLNSVHATYWCVCVVYSAESYVVFTLGCVGFVKLFRGWFRFKIEHPTRDLLLLQQPKDQQRDQPGKCLYCARAFWLYLQSHCRLRNGSLVYCVCFMSVYYTPNNGPFVTLVALKK